MSNRLCYTMLFYFLQFHQIFAQVLFVEVAEQIGITHTSVRHGSIMQAQGGAAWFDYNNDGWYDLFLTGGEGEDVLYRNEGNGVFSDQTESSGLSSFEIENSNGVTTGDYDGDGFEDVFVTTYRGSPNHLLRNNGDGTLEDVPWVGMQDTASSFSASFGDLNNDGALDLYVCNWSNFYDQIEISDPLTPDIVTTYSVDAQSNYCYMNLNDGSFYSAAGLLGVADSLGCGLAVALTDIDFDNDLDIFLANDFGVYPGNSTNHLFVNEHPNETFTDAGNALGLNIGMYGMGVAKADINNDGLFDFYVTNIGNDMLFVSDSLNGYSDQFVARGLVNDSVWSQDNIFKMPSYGWGVGFLDVDNDTDQDLMIARGSIAYEYPLPTFDHNKLFLNQGAGNFIDYSSEANFESSSVCRALAYCDFDKDGDLDVYVGITDTMLGLSNGLLYRNESETQNWLQVRAVGTESNVTGIGVKIYCYIDGVEQFREIGGQSSFNSQHWHVAHFGLASGEVVDSVAVHWTTGTIETYYNIQSNQFIEVIEGQGLVTAIDEYDLRNVLVYPNPTASQLNVRCNSGHSLEITSITGQVILSSITVPGVESHIDVSDLSSGLYIVKIYFDDAVVYRRFMKE